MVYVCQGEPIGVTFGGLCQGRIHQLSTHCRLVLSGDSVSLPQPNQQTQTNHSHQQLGLFCHGDRVIQLDSLRWFAQRRNQTHVLCARCVRQTDGRTDRQNCDSNTVRCVACSHTVKNVHHKNKNITHAFLSKNKQDNVQANWESVQSCLYLSSSFFEIFDVQFWWLWTRTVQGHPVSKVMVSIVYLVVFEIFDAEVLWPRSRTV